MRCPIKLNRSRYSGKLWRFLPSTGDPRQIIDTKSVDGVEFSELVSTFRFNGVYKTTTPNRYPHTIEYIRSLPETERRVIIDIGASDGTASLDMLKNMTFDEYNVTDANTRVFYINCKRGTYFYDSKKDPILFASNNIIAYPDTKGAILPIGILVNFIFVKLIPDNALPVESFNLFSPDVLQLQNRIPNVRTLEYDIFNPWNLNRGNLIIAANILNPGNFSEEKMTLAFENINNALHDDGRLVVIDNRGQRENATVFRKQNSRLHIEHVIGEGCSVTTQLLITHG